MSDDNKNNPSSADSDPELNYENYSLDEMLEAYESIDKKVFPDRAEALRKLILERQPAISGINHSEEKIIASSKVKFHGNGTEFFAIWIVNILLSIVTLGIYSAWATVRTNRYFYSNTEIVGHRLAYLAEPLQILKGRIIAVLLLAVYLIISHFSPQAGIAVILLIALLTPFIICMSVRFRMRMMSYRNVRFNFKMRYGRAFVVFFLFPILGFISLYLAMPWVVKKIDEFLHEGMEYGNKDFKPELSAGEYYIAVILSSVIGIAGFIAIAITMGVGFSLGSLENDSWSVGKILPFGIAAIMYFLIIVVTSAFYKAHIRNHLYNSTRIKDVAAFKSDVKFLSLAGLYATNYLMLIFSLGLAYPWVKVRTSRFFADSTNVTVFAGIEDVVADSGSQDSAVADEVVGAFDIDLSLG